MYPSSITQVRQSRADVSSELSSFYAGTQFRVFKEISLAAGASMVLKLERACDIIIRGFSLDMTDGELKAEIFSGSTPSGSFSEAVPIFPKNISANLPVPVYKTQAVMTTGGTIANGTLIDVLRAKTTNASGQISSIGAKLEDQYGAPAGIGYYKISNPGNSAAVCVFKMWWEELPTV